MAATRTAATLIGVTGVWPAILADKGAPVLVLARTMRLLA